MNLNNKINELTSQNIREEFEDFYNKLKTAIETNELFFVTTEDDSVIFERAHNKAINTLTYKEKFRYYYENH